MLIYKYWKNVQTGKSLKHDEYMKLDDDGKNAYESETDPFYKAIFTSWGDGSLSEQANQLISSIGLEYIYNSMISLRTGYYYDYDGKVQYPTFGAGLQYDKYRFDFSYISADSDSPLTDTMRFSLTAGF
jgi:hypothetical protein